MGNAAKITNADKKNTKVPHKYYLHTEFNDSGNEFLTPDVPRTIEEVEQTVQG